MAKPQTSSYRGVTWSKRHSKWQAGISLQSRYLYLGAFDKEHDAARTWDLAAIKSRGTRAKTNFDIRNYLNNDGSIISHAKLDASLAHHSAKRARADSMLEIDQPTDQTAAAANTSTSVSTEGTSRDSKRGRLSTRVLSASWSSDDSRTECLAGEAAAAAVTIQVQATQSAGSTGGSSVTAADAAAEMELVQALCKQDVWSGLSCSGNPARAVSSFAGISNNSDTSLSQHTSRAASLTSLSDNDIDAGLADDPSSEATAQQQGAAAAQNWQQLDIDEHDIFLAQLQALQQPLVQQQEQHSSLDLTASGQLLPLFSSRDFLLSSSCGSGDGLGALSPQQQQLDCTLLPVVSLSTATPCYGGTGSAADTISANITAYGADRFEQLKLLEPGSAVHAVLPGGYTTCGAVLVAHAPASKLQHFLPWKAVVWEADAWHQIGSYANYHNAQQACLYVLSNISVPGC